MYMSDVTVLWPHKQANHEMSESLISSNWNSKHLEENHSPYSTYLAHKVQLILSFFMMFIAAAESEVFFCDKMCLLCSMLCVCRDGLIMQ